MLLHARSVTTAASGTSATPAPSGCDGVMTPYAVVSPYSNRADVLVPFGLTVPFKVAPKAPMLVVGFVGRSARDTQTW